MRTLGFRTLLDVARHRRPRVASVAAVRPDNTDLGAVAARLRVLAPVPEPHLGAGRSRFLAEAVRLEAHSAERPTLAANGLRSAAVSSVAVLAIVIVGTVMVAGGNSGTWSPERPLSASATPGLTPTYTVTPTRIAFAPTAAPPAVPASRSAHAPWGRLDLVPQPEPTALGSHAELCILDRQSDDV